MDVTGSISPENLGDHVIFGYQNVPSCSFTSDPAAVKPPTYEEVVNNVNPLYLYHNGGTYNNPVFNLKDEHMDPATAFSPPPPYSEVPLIANNTAPPVQGRGSLARNDNSLEHEDQGQVTILSEPLHGCSIETPQDACSATWAQARVSEPASTAPNLIQEAQNLQSTDMLHRESNHFKKAGKDGKEEPLAASAASCNREAAAIQCNEAEELCSNTTAGTPITISTCPSSPPRTLLSIASSSPSQSVTAETKIDSSSFSDFDASVEVGGARRREAARDTDVTVGVGGARVHMTAESRPTAPLTPVYLSEDSEGATPHRAVDTKPTAVVPHHVTQVGDGELDTGTSCSTIDTQAIQGETSGQAKA
ncbi:hypothetical protein ElyMa_005001000 [Elysia marginata]|uniref:Uncharacterized protein n=1 Tax=Elysia marginata TaxID=1093978 RepID=A0AAV4J694_9GAST|nr:hypothetical protein ElyMa_005001000 [Elysia marginata]